MTNLLAYHNDPTIKAKYVARFAAHRSADAVIQGTDDLLALVCECRAPGAAS